MIRDPSDGSVKEILGPVERPGQRAERILEPRTAPHSGLPFGSTKPEHIERLERSRKQLEQFRKTGVWDDMVRGDN